LLIFALEIIGSLLNCHKVLLKTVRLLIDKSLIKKIYPTFFEQAYPTDLLIALLWLIIDILAIYLPVLNETPIRVILILPGILFLPGYCLIAALFPKKDEIDLGERIAISIGLSIAVVPMIVLGLNYTPFGIRLDPILIALTVFILLMILVASYRRSLLLPEERFGIPFFEIAGTLWNTIFPKDGSRADHLISVVIALVILAGVILTVYLIAVPKEEEHFTEFFILGENMKVSDYPDLIIAGQNYPLYIGVGNHEYRNTNYTIETWLVHTEFDNVTNTSHLIAMDPSENLSFILAHNETRIIPYNLSVNETAYNRVEFLLFKDNVYDTNLTGSNRINASYRELHLWITVDKR
jgi:uncharacterized membrane protein